MKKFETFTHWTTEFTQQGCYDHLNEMVALDEWQDWPSCKALATLLPYEIENLNNKVIEFVPQKPEQDFSAVAYEEVIYKTGQVPTRDKSWHDLFGALVWCLFPQTKAKVNQLHHIDIQEFGKEERTKRRNALTLFDECGVVIVSKNNKLLDALRNHRWQEVFVENRDLWFDKSEQGIAAYQFGHANYEMLTKPFEGLTGKWLLIDASAELTSLPLSSQYRLLDQKLSALLEAGALDDNSKMSPLPLLGVPGWYDKNQEPSFYDNTDYFRPKRNEKK